jgi:hypothetical protein
LTEEWRVATSLLSIFGNHAGISSPCRVNFHPGSCRAPLPGEVQYTDTENKTSVTVIDTALLVLLSSSHRGQGMILILHFQTFLFKYVFSVWKVLTCVVISDHLGLSCFTSFIWYVREILSWVLRIFNIFIAHKFSFNTYL